MTIDNLNITKYPTEWNIKRNPVRPTELRLNNFDKLYDWDNLWIDAIQVNEKLILLIGPPLYDTTEFIRNNKFQFVNDAGTILNHEFYERDRVCITSVNATSWVDKIWLTNGLYTTQINIIPISSEFNNKKVIVTPSKNHPIEWLRQWIDYHVSLGFDGFLIYDNNTDTYTSEHLYNELSRPDIVLKVVKYYVPVGPMGGSVEGMDPNFMLPWDSDFASYVLYEHAKWRYLHSCSLVSNAHTDELLIFNGNSIANLANDANVNSVWIIHGKWVQPINSKSGLPANQTPINERKFQDYYHTLENEGTGITGGMKWILNPKKNLSYQWAIHSVYGPRVFTDSIKFGHFLGMNMGIERKRDAFTGDPMRLVEWEDLKYCFERWSKSN